MNREISVEQEDFDPIARAAAEWVLRLPQATAADEAEFSRWLAADPRHEEVFAEMNETSGLLDQLRDPALAEKPLAPVVPIAVTAPVRKRAWKAWMGAAGVAAAAAVAFGYVSWWRPAYGAVQEIAATERGGQQRLELPDGSVVTLNTASSVEVAFSREERRVRLLKGEAFFTVAKNPKRPFYVEAGAVSVRAVGTAFNVRRRAEGVEVLVTEGKVKVDEDVGGSLPTSPKPEFYLVAGQKTMVAREVPVEVSAPAAPIELPVAAVVAPEEINRALAWKESRLRFSETPLSEIVAEFNRYNQVQLVIGDASLADQRFGGAFTPTGYDSFLEVLEQNFGITAQRKGSEIVLRKAL